MEVKNKNELLNLLKTSRGQLEFVIKMVEEDRYCVDISKQVLAVKAQLKKANLKIIDQHIKHCVNQVFFEGYGDEKVDEVILLLDKYLK